MRLRTFSITLLTLALGACAVGPDYKTPSTSAGALGKFVSDEEGTAIASAALPDQWWRLYHDATLDRLIADALSANTDVRTAVARLEQSRSVLWESTAERLPTTNLDARVERQRLSSINTLPGEDRNVTYTDAGFNVSYELDLFGRVRRNVEAARGDVDAAQADLDAARVSVVADTTRAYVDAASAAQRLAVGQHIVDLLQQSLKLTERREEAGFATRLDIVRIDTLLQQRRAELPTITAQRQAALFRLAVLLGRTPRELPVEASAITMPPTLSSPIPAGDGRALLARRPDVRAAERRLAGATARIGVATADLYPRISLGASIGSASYNGFDNFFGAGPLQWLAGPLISWSFPNQAKIRARIAGAKADANAALAQFDGSVLRALSETETALSSYSRSLDNHAALKAARDQAERAVKIVRGRQREGQVDSLSLLDAERTFAEAEAQLADADGRIAGAQVDVFKALGGGWETAPS